MDVAFSDPDLERLYTEATFTMNLSPALVKAYRKRLQTIRAAIDERDFYAQKSFRYEKLKGKRQHQRSMRLNDQFRLVVEIEEVGGSKRVRIMGVEDYHD